MNMKARTSLVLAILLVVSGTMGAWAAAGAPAQMLQATPTAMAEAQSDDTGHRQGFAILKAEANKTTAMPGDEVRFVLQIKSTGTWQLDGPRVEYAPPTGLTILNAISSRGKLIDFWDEHATIDVVNLAAGDAVDITIVAKVGATVAEGTALVSHFMVSSANSGAQEAIIGVAVGQPAKATAAGLPTTGGGVLLLLVGVVLAGGLIALRQFRTRKPTTNA
jgi:hypothetical protein